MRVCIAVKNENEWNWDLPAKSDELMDCCKSCSSPKPATTTKWLTKISTFTYNTSFANQRKKVFVFFFVQQGRVMVGRLWFLSAIMLRWNGRRRWQMWRWLLLRWWLLLLLHGQIVAVVGHCGDGHGIIVWCDRRSRGRRTTWTTMRLQLLTMMISGQARQSCEGGRMQRTARSWWRKRIG